MGIICLGVIGWTGVHSSSSVMGRNDVLHIARAEVGVKEIGSNDGKRVREYLAYTGINQPAAWCAAYVSFVFHTAGYSQPRTAWSPALFPVARIVKEPKPANVFGVYFPELKRIAHVGLVEKIKDDWIYSIEGNSNNNGGRNGDGVYQRLRHKRTIYRYANWLD